MIAQVHADRKGAIAYAACATLGVIFIVSAVGYPKLSLIFSLGHASFRMVQVIAR